MKKLFTGILAAIMILSCCPAFVVGAASAYNPKAAIEYAAAHWNDGVGLCARFVSECLKAGGCSAYSSSCGKLLKQLQDNNYGTLYKLNVNNNVVLASENEGKVSVGDPIFYCCDVEGCDNNPHVVIAGSIDSKGRICGYAHNAAKNNETIWKTSSIKCHNTTCNLYSFHMNSSLNAYNDGYLYKSLDNDNSNASFPGKWIRSTDSTSGTLVGSIPYGEYAVVTKYNSAKTWAYVSYKGIEGWTMIYEKTFPYQGPYTCPVVTFNANGGSVSTGSKKVYINTPYGTLPTPTRSGYIFDGWYTSANGGTRITSSTNVTLTANQTLYAHWSKEECSHSYKTYTESTHPHEKYKKCTKCGEIVDLGTVYDDDCEECNPKPKTYTITYNANGGTGAPSSQVKEHGVDITLSSKIPTREGYVFSCWTDTPFGGSGYLPGEKYKVNEDITFYALWENVVEKIEATAADKQIQYYWCAVISPTTSEIVVVQDGQMIKRHGVDVYDSNGEYQTLFVQPIDEESKYYDENTPLTPINEQGLYDFSAYKNRLSSLYYIDANTVHFDIIMDYTVTYNANGGSVSPSSKTVTYFAKYGTLATPTRPGYTFNGWYTALNGGRKVTSSSIVTDASNHTLYAHWSMEECSHSYKTYTESTHPHEKYKKCTKCGEIVDLGTVYDDDCEECNPKPKTYTITYNANGGTGAPSSQVKEHGESINLRNVVPSKDGYVFKGWSVSSDASSVDYYPNDVYSANKDLTLYAVWETYTISETVTPNYQLGQPVKVTIPTFNVRLAGRLITNEYRQYPLIVYNDITYFPMTYYDSRLLGLKTDYSLSTGLKITQNDVEEKEYFEDTTHIRNSGTYTATVASGAIYVNGTRIHNESEEYPLLLFRNITYFPLTWRFAVREFGWSYYFDSTNGLIIS